LFRTGLRNLAGLLCFGKTACQTMVIRCTHELEAGIALLISKPVGGIVTCLGHRQTLGDKAKLLNILSLKQGGDHEKNKEQFKKTKPIFSRH
jgi:hypothetical protein